MISIFPQRVGPTAMKPLPYICVRDRLRTHYIPAPSTQAVETVMISIFPQRVGPSMKPLRPLPYVWHP